ncbi:NADP-dependent oxidoreductase [Spongiibacter sp. KMU-166]|uniref:NADP-dependent oxidoreductase n=1 Tax=Spongiibacter thalassae TaxID=2721624 RepID=A0ABX1G9X7_9GAMM|nr:NADP-dependent oxidoreductase [Spongiibacter thalassae]NKI15965.1 NADP-dependent oxidoreductase [Spongiibacter thalassae]
MKRIMLDNYNSPADLKLRNAERRPPKAGEVSIRVVSASVNPADWKICEGFLKDVLPKSLPFCPGLDVSGEVVEVGSGVTRLQAGDRVVAALTPMDEGTYAEYVTANADYFAVVPDALNLIDVAAIPTAGLTGVQLVRDGLGVKSGQRILITGATGAVGLATVVAAKEAGAFVIAAVRDKYRERAAAIGANEIFAVDDPSSYAALEPVNGIADTVGGALADSLMSKIKPGGCLSTVATSPISAAPPIGVEVSQTFFVPSAADLEQIMGWMVGKRLTFPVAARLPLRDAAEAQDMVKRGGLNGKVLLIPDS